MCSTKKEIVTFPSSNGADTVTGYFYTGAETPKAVVQLSHGMCEHLACYDRAAEFLVRHGYAVCGNDHLGHGATGGKGQDGFFADRHGGRCLVEDLREMNRLAHSRYPSLPVILLGHSMGSFFARDYAAVYPETISGLILSGTGGPNPFAPIGKGICKSLIALRGPRYVSKKLDRLVFGRYNRRVPSPKTRHDWITRDEEFIEWYRHDKKCTFLFSVSAFYELFSVVQRVNTPDWAARVPAALPVYFYAGDQDPVGDYGRGVRAAHDLLRKSAHSDLTLRLYQGGRHDMFHELNRAEVYQELLDWLEERF